MSAAGAGRPAKRARLEADKRRDALAEVEDKYADIDFTRFQKVVDIDTDADGEATPLRFVLVRPVETALVKDWRQWSSYEPDEAGETLSEEGLAHLCTTRRQRRHYTGPFGCTVQSNLPAPGQLLSKAGSAVQGRTALDKLRKQLAVMCLRIELQHFCGVSGDTIDADALGRANSNARLVGGEGAVLTMEEATAWGPPAYPLVGDGLVLARRSAHLRAVADQDTIDLLLRKGAAIDKLQQAAAGAASSSAQEFLAALEVLASVINGATHVCDLEEGAGLRAHMDCLGLAPSSKIAMVPQPGGGKLSSCSSATVSITSRWQCWNKSRGGRPGWHALTGGPCRLLSGSSGTPPSASALGSTPSNKLWCVLSEPCTCHERRVAKVSLPMLLRLPWPCRRRPAVLLCSKKSSSLSLALPRHALPFEPIISTSTLCFYIIPLTH